MPLQASEEIMDMKKMVRSFVRKEIFPIEQQIEDEAKIPDNLIRKFKEMGFYGITIPKEYGGLGLGTLGYCLILEELPAWPRERREDRRFRADRAERRLGRRRGRDDRR